MKSSKELFEELQNNIAISNFEKEEYTLKKKIDWRGYTMKKKIVAISTACFILISGVAFAFNGENIINYFRGLGNGIDSAIENGYIAEPNMEYESSRATTTDEAKGITLDDINVKAKIEDFLMDDLNISTHFLFEIDTKINDTIDFDDLKSVELKDLIVTDEENRILYCMNKEAFDKYCVDNNLNYNFSEFNENYYNCGLNNFIVRKTKENGNIQLTYNMYTGGEQSYPKSKKLYFKFSNIVLKRNDWLENENSIVNLKGNWEMDVDVPEKMYNRKSISYKVIKNENKDFEITNATLYDTGFEFGMIVSNMKRPEIPQLVKDLWKQQEDGKIDVDEMNRLINEDEEIHKAFEEYMSRPIETYRYSPTDSYDTITYVENEKGQKFESTMSPSRRQDGNYIAGDKYSFFETFGLTSSDATDKLKVKVLFKDTQYTIELERVK